MPERYDSYNITEHMSTEELTSATCNTAKPGKESP
jgi:hypothetical protein